MQLAFKYYYSDIILLYRNILISHPDAIKQYLYIMYTGNGVITLVLLKPMDVSRLGPVV